MKTLKLVERDGDTAVPADPVISPVRTSACAHVLCRAGIGAAIALLSGYALAQGTLSPPPALAGQAPAAAAKFVEVLATKAHLEQLRNGGFALYLRHGNTDNTKPDRVPTVDLSDCSTQRPLTDEGRKAVARVGEEMRAARIPIGEFRVSPLCRARESAALAFPKLTPEVDKDLIYLANLTDDEKAPVLANTRRLLSQAVPAGTNRLLLAHAPNLMDLIGYFPKEATLVILRPRGVSDQQGFDYVASIPPAHWANLVK